MQKMQTPTHTVYRGKLAKSSSRVLKRRAEAVCVAGAWENEDRDKTWCTSCDSIELPVPELTCNAEADTRVLLHIKQAGGPRKLVYSPDTDVYHIGLTNIDLNGDEITIQLSTIGRKLKLLHLNLLCASLNSDPALHSIPDCVKLLQTLYIATGCDFTSFFRPVILHLSKS